MKKTKLKQDINSAKKPRRKGKPSPATKGVTRIYGKLDNGSIFLLTPQWLSEWEKPDKKLLKLKHKTEG